jgi:energy-coupling factor transporter ATP-binding protein EcfA2
MKLYLENVRSFEGWHEIPIASATVLLGENSAGKSTLLGMLAVVQQEGFPFSGNFFNSFPFEFGGYKTLANSKKKTGHFSVGFQTQVDDRFNQLRNSLEKTGSTVSTGLIVAFRENDGLPVPCHVFGWYGDFAVEFFEIDFESLNPSSRVVMAPDVKLEILQAAETKPQGLTQQGLFQAYFEKSEKGKKRGEKTDRKRIENYEYLLHMMFMSGFRRLSGNSALAFAPMRSRPKRTYDQLSDEFTPEGDHVPLLLARATDPDNKQAKALHDALRDFGRYSEMFSDVGVKKLGRGSGDPFQVQVKMGSKQANLMDVGYGVSQILPLIVDAQMANAKTMLLLQQPEVHLHPKAQAALGSMIKDWVSKSKKTVVVETHSDYLVDRLRLEVKKERLRPDDLRIFYLEKKGASTKLHVLEVDAQGNLLNPPEGYRDFFMLEQLALLRD